MNFSKICTVALAALLFSTPALSIEQLGWGGTGQSNTDKAAEIAMIAGQDGIEIDLVETANGIAFGGHDDNLAVETNGTGLASEKTWGEIMHLRKTAGGYRLSKLSDIVSEFKKWPGDRPLFLDPRTTSATAVRNGIEEAGGFPESRLSITVFTVAQYLPMRAEFPGAQIYWKSYNAITSFTAPVLAWAASTGYDGLAFSVDMALLHSDPTYLGDVKDLVARLEVENLKSFTFLADTKADVEILDYLQIDYVVMVSNHFNVEPQTVIQVGWGGAEQLNSVAAIAGSGADHHMIDLQLSSDSFAVGNNSSTLDAETNGTGPVNAQTLAQLQLLVKNNGDPMASLEQLLTQALVNGDTVVLDVGPVPASVVATAATTTGFPVEKVIVLAYNNAQLADYRTNFYDGVPVFRKVSDLDTVDPQVFDASGYDGFFCPSGFTQSSLDAVHGLCMEVMSHLSGDIDDVDLEAFMRVDFTVSRDGFYQ